MSRFVVIFLLCVPVPVRAATVMIDNFDEGDFSLSADITTPQRSLTSYQAVGSLPGGTRQLYLGSFQRSDVVDPHVKAMVNDGNLSIDSDFPAELFRLVYGALEDQVGPIGSQSPMNLDLRNATFTIDFNYYLPRSSDEVQSVCISSVSGSYYAPTGGGDCRPLDESSSPFSILISTAAFQGGTDLSDADQLIISMGVPGVGFAASAFSIEAIHFVPEPVFPVAIQSVFVIFVVLSKRNRNVILSES